MRVEPSNPLWWAQRRSASGGPVPEPQGFSFRWVYPFRLDDSGFPPKLVFPDSPVSFEVLPEFPWGDAAPTDDRVRGYLRTLPKGGLGERLTDAVRAVAQANPALSGVVDVVDFNATAVGQRIVPDDYLKALIEALREAVLNALMHRDYADSGDIQVRLYPDRLSLWNPGTLYGGLTVEVLRREDHPSRLRNPAIAQVLYYAGLVERWGSGITRIRQALRDQGLPEPEMAEEAGGFRLTFLKDAYTPELLRARGLSERQVWGVMYAKEHGGIGNREYQEVAGVSKCTASRDLEQLTEAGIFERVGETGKGTRYVLKGPQRGQTGQEAAMLEPYAAMQSDTDPLSPIADVLPRDYSVNKLESTNHLTQIRPCDYV